MKLLDLKHKNWFENYFENYHLFGYIGDRGNLNQELTKKGFWRKLIEIIVPKVNIATILNSISEINLVKNNSSATIAEEIIELVTEHNNQKKVNEVLENIYKNAKKNKIYFNKVSSFDIQGNTLFKSDFNQLQSRLITVEGQLIHKKSISKYSQTVYKSLNTSPQEWILSDFPPYSFTDNISSFDGKVILLNEDKGFSETFGDLLPFNKDIEWYPYVRITGFFDISKIQTQLYPSMTMCFIEYRRPINYRAKRKNLLDLIQSEIRHPIYLKDLEDKILLNYLCRIIFKGSNIDFNDLDTELKSEIMNIFNISDIDDISNLINNEQKLLKST